jgi:methionyl-tRNA formyltransferase
MKDIGTLPRETDGRRSRGALSAVVMGKGELAIRAAEWFVQSPLYDLIAIVPVVPEPTWTPSLASWARARGVTVVDSGHFRDIPDLAEEAWKADVVLSVFYDRIIKDWFIRRCNKILNLHNGPLPKYRGVSPINWALKNGEPEHGVTLHEITPGIDDGPIVAQLKYSIYPELDEVTDVYNRAIEYGWVLLQQTLPLIDTIKPRPQIHSEALYYNKAQNALLGERRNFTKKESCPAGSGENVMIHADEVTK